MSPHTNRINFAAVLALLALTVWGVVTAFAHQTGKEKTAPLSLIYPNGLALAADGALFISDIGVHSVFKLNRQGKLILIAGTGAGGFGGDGGPAIKAQLHAPHDLAFDAAGNLFIADTFNHCIRRIDRQGIITTVVGNGKAELAGDNGPATQAALNNPQGLAFDRAGRLLIADTYNHVVRRVDERGAITTVAGSVPGHGGDGGPAVKAQINLTMAVAVAPAGDIYVSAAADSRIRRIALDGIIQTIVGFGPAQDTYGAGFAGDDGPAEKAKIFSATDLKCDAAGNLYLADSGNHRIRVIRNGVIRTIAGSGRQGSGGDGGPATAADLNTPQKIVVAPAGGIFIADRANRRVRKVDARGFISTVAGAGRTGMLLDPEISK